MKKNILIIIVLLSLLSCNESRDNILSQKDFTNLLVDIHIADSYVVEKALFDKDLNNDSLSYYNSIFKKYNINRSSFDENINYYTLDLKTFEAIYSDVVRILKEKEKVVDSLRLSDVEMKKNE